MSNNNKPKSTGSFRLQPPPGSSSLGGNGGGSMRQSRNRRPKTRAGLDLEGLEEKQGKVFIVL